MIIRLHLTIVFIVIKLFGSATQIIGRLYHNFVMYNCINVYAHYITLHLYSYEEKKMEEIYIAISQLVE